MGRSGSFDEYARQEQQEPGRQRRAKQCRRHVTPIMRLRYLPCTAYVDSGSGTITHPDGGIPLETIRRVMERVDRQMVDVTPEPAPLPLDHKRQ